MLIIDKKQELIAKIKDYKKIGKSIGFVPTMGYLHAGHLSLVHSSCSDNDITVVSIFVNPKQFGEGEDLASYPRDFEHDSKLLSDAKVDIIFAPDVNEMYGEEPLTEVYVDKLSALYCGVTRPIHFKGVATVIAKFFNIVSPDRAYFGEKDFQQVAVIRKMVKDLDFQIEIKQVPIVREVSGLALSSRNTYLSADERIRADTISKSLFDAKEMVLKTGISLKPDKIIDNLSNELMKHNILIEYIKIIDPETLSELHTLQKRVTIILAVRIGKTRLIDNITVEV